ncbi:MAG: NifB/NifX family molybdenum-iron cluster-binding protein [Candidatus Micrarchaeia archaeon]
MQEKIIMAVIDENGMLTGVGRAPRVAIIYTKDGKVEKIEEIDVRWDKTHENEQEGLHHASVAKFIKEHKVNEIIASGSGPDMRRMLERLGLTIKIGSGYYKDFI